jgi:hypothetical protein
MPTGLTSTIVTNSALQQIASQTRIASLTDGSPAANYANVIYAPTVQLMLRELDPDFARFTAPLVASGAITPVPPWGFEYAYPSDMIRLRQVQPPSAGTGALADPFDPHPVRANVAFDLIGGVATKVILTNLPNALAVYTTSQVTEAQWDSVFSDAVVRRLANPLAMALSGRPDFAEKILMQSAQMAQTCEMVDEGGFRRGMSG